MVRRQQRKARPTLTPGKSKHEGLVNGGVDYDSGLESGGDETKGMRKKKSGRKNRVTRLGGGRQEEGVLYTVKLVEHHQSCRVKRGGIFNTPGASKDVLTEDDEEVTLPQSIGPQQYTIEKMNKPKYGCCARFFRSFGIELGKNEDVDAHLYRPSKYLYKYLNWTFHASFSAVFLSFLVIFIILCLIFAGLYELVGNWKPNCIIVSGEDFGTNPNSKFTDAFALSWTTFTTVGYGNTYPATGTDLVITSAHCSAVVFLCTFESFLGLIFAGMCAAILFGKVNRVQSHAHITFANAVCLQYEELHTNILIDSDASDSDCDDSEVDADTSVKGDSKCEVKENRRKTLNRADFMDQFWGCPVLKFQVVNDLCNEPGGEIIDGIMKVVGMKLKRWGGKPKFSQYVRVNLVDCEHPFFGRVWTPVHILDASSPLLTSSAREKIRQNHGEWPDHWLTSPERIRKKLDFQSLVVSVAGVSNVSASTVHAYKRYKPEDVIIGFDFAPLVYQENDRTGKLKVDMTLRNDVIEQQKGRGEDLISGTVPLNDRSEQLSALRTRGTSSIFKKSIFRSISK